MEQAFASGGGDPAPEGKSFDLSRFVRAQAGVYRTALDELSAGEKRRHWMWFVFPQITGLGLSANARLYAISGSAEAEAYLAHDLLGPRLLECTTEMLGWAGRKTSLDILGPIDELKFKSSMTLFEVVGGADPCFGKALEIFFDGTRDRETLSRLAG